MSRIVNFQNIEGGNKITNLRQVLDNQIKITDKICQES